MMSSYRWMLRDVVISMKRLRIVCAGGQLECGPNLIRRDVEKELIDSIACAKHQRKRLQKEGVLI